MIRILGHHSPVRPSRSLTTAAPHAFARFDACGPVERPCCVPTLALALNLFKRQVYGIHHHISVKHLDAYLGEMCYRYSNRNMQDGARVNDLLSQAEGSLTHKALTHDPQEEIS